MSFESDLNKLRESPNAAPSVKMRIRHERRMTPDTSVVAMMAGDRSSQRQVVALYDVSATKGTRPEVVVEIDPTVNLDCVEQGAIVTVRGWPVVGRGVVIEPNHGLVVEATYPCISPLLRAMRFK